MVLSAGDKTYIDLMSGNDCAPVAVNAAAYAVLESELGAVGNCAYIVAILEVRLARATRVSGLDNTGGQIPNPSIQGIKDTLTLWQSRCPDSLPALSVSRLLLGIDEDWDNAP